MSELPDGALLARLARSLLDAFSPEELERLVAYTLGERLSSIAGGEDLARRVDNLLAWSQRQGKLPQLLAGAIAERPQNQALKDLVAALHGSDRAGQQYPDENMMTDDRTNERLDRIFTELGAMRGDIGGLRGEVAILKGELTHLQGRLPQKESATLNWSVIALALIVAVLLSVGTYVISVAR